MLRIFLIAGTLALASCVPPPASAPVSPIQSAEPEPFYKNLPQWTTMCEQQPDSPACFCLKNKADPQCQN